MFNYIKETIINDSSAIIAGSAENGLGEGVVAVKRAGNYKIASIVNSKIFKTVGSAGKKAKAVITPEALGSADVVRISIFLSTPGTEFVEFAMPSWQEYGKPIIVETKTATVKGIAEALKLALPSDNKLYKVTQDELTVTLEAAETWMDFAEVHYDLVTFGTCAECGADESVENHDEAVVITPGKKEFATAKWIIENLRFPSQPNLRYTPLYADESPVAGTTYTQYSFQYKVEKSVPGGVSGVGQVVDSVVTIVFYVAPAAQSAFEAAFGSGLLDTTTDNK